MTQIFSSAVGHVSAVGKLVGEPEYIRADTEALASFDSWLDSSFEEAFDRWGNDWRATFRQGRSYSFLWWPPGEEGRKGPFCGVIAPSRDSVGRDYPFAVLTQVPRKIIACAPHALPLAMGAFLNAAYGLVVEARTVPVSRTELATKLRTIPIPGEGDIVRARDVYAHWCSTIPSAEGWAAIVAGASVPEEIAREAATRRDEESLRVPLGASGERAATLWLDVRGRTTGSAAHSSFWSIDDRVLFVARGSAAQSLLGALWAEKTIAHVAPPSPAWSPKDSEGDSSMASFLETLGVCPVLSPS